MLSFIRSMKTIRGLSPGSGAAGGEASQDGPEQKANKRRSDEHAAAPGAGEKHLCLGRSEPARAGGREEAREEDLVPRNGHPRPRPRREPGP